MLRSFRCFATHLQEGTRDDARKEKAPPDRSSRAIGAGSNPKLFVLGATVLVSVMLCSFISMMMSMNRVTMRSMGVVSTLL